MAIVLAGLAVYSNSLSGPFIFDDQSSIPDNPSIRHLTSIGHVLSPPPGGRTVSGRPVLNLSLAVNYALGGNDTWGYHVANLAIHLFNGLLLWGILRRTFELPGPRSRLGDAGGALAGAIALLWTVHPLQTESVTYIVQRAESLAGLFYLLTLYAVIRGATSQPGTMWYVVSVVGCLLGVGTKEIVATSPLVVLLYDRTFLAGSFAEAWRRRRGLYGGLAATWLALAGLMMAMGSRGATAGFGQGISPWEYLLTQFGAIAHYLRLSFWPLGLCLDYGTPLARTCGEVLPGALLVSALAAATAWALVRHPAAGFLGAFFLVVLAPSSSIVPVVTQTIAEHRMYLSLAAVVTSVVMTGYLAGQTLMRRGRLDRRTSVAVGVFLVALIAVVLGFLTFRRNEVYQTRLTIWLDTVQKAPGNFGARINLGGYLLEAGRTTEAITQYEEAVRLKPDHATGYVNLGAALCRSGRDKEALEQYDRAIQHQRDFAVAWHNKAVLLAALNRTSEAVEHYQQALRLKPDYVDARCGLAAILIKSKQAEKAIEQWQEVLRINPDHAPAYCSWGAALISLERFTESIQPLQQGLKLDPRCAEARRDLGAALTRIGRPSEAIEHLQQALQIDPGCAEAHYNLGIAFSGCNRLQEAADQYREAVRLKPDYVEAFNNWANVLLDLGRHAEGMERLQEALRIQPGQPLARKNLGTALLNLGRTKEAVEQFQQALKLNPDYADAHHALSFALIQQKEFPAAIDHASEAFRLSPKDPQLVGFLAWLLATHDTSEGGDPQRAVLLAEQAHALVGRPTIPCLDTLAAAYASAGRFNEAIAKATEARDLAQTTGRPDQAHEINMRLQLYRDHKPCRESANR